MATEAQTPQPMSVMPKDEIKEFESYHFDKVGHEAYLVELKKAEDEEYTTSSEAVSEEELKVDENSKESENHVFEGKVGNSEDEHFLVSNSVANTALEETSKASDDKEKPSDDSEDKEKPILVEKKSESVMQLGEQNSMATTIEDEIIEDAEIVESSKLPLKVENGEFLEVAKQHNGNLSGLRNEEAQEGEILNHQLDENTEAKFGEQVEQTIGANESIQEEKVATGSQKDDIEEEMLGEDQLHKSGEEDDQTVGATPDHNQETSPLNLIKYSLGDDVTIGASEKVEVSLNDDLDLDNTPIEQKAVKSNPEEVIEVDEHKSSYLGNEEIEAEKKEGDEISQASLGDICTPTATTCPNEKEDSLEEDGTTSHKLDIPSIIEATEEAEFLKPEPEETETLECASSHTKETVQPKEEVPIGNEKATTDDNVEQQIILEGEAIEEKIERSLEAEELVNKNEPETAEDPDVDGASKDSTKQIKKEDDVVEDQLTVSTEEETVTESNQEDEKEANIPENEECIEIETDINDENNHDYAVKSESLVYVGEETDKSSSHEDEEPKKAEVEVFEKLEMNGAKEDRAKDIVDDGDVTHLFPAPSDDEIPQEDEVHQRSEGSVDSEVATEQIVEETATDPPNISLGEETISTDENKVVQELETTKAVKDNLEESVEEHGLHTDISAIETRELTASEAFTDKRVSEDINLVNVQSSIPVEEETVQASVEHEEAEKNERIDEDGNGDIIENQIVEENIIAEHLPAVSLDEETTESSEVHNETTIEDDTVKESVVKHVPIADISAVAARDVITPEDGVENIAPGDNNAVKEEETNRVKMSTETAILTVLETNKPEVEVFEGSETNGVVGDTEKQIVEDDVTHPSTLSAYEETIEESSCESEVHENIEDDGDDKVTEKEILEDNEAGTELPSISIGEDITQSSEENEVHREIETSSPEEETLRESVEDHGAVTGTSEVTAIEDSQEEKNETPTYDREIKESEIMPEELNFETTDSKQVMETATSGDQEDTNIPKTSGITEALGEEIQESSNENLAGFVLAPEVPEEHIEGNTAGEREINEVNLERESVLMIHEEVSLREAQPEDTKVVDACDIPSEVMGPVPTEANGTSLEALHVEGMELEKNSNADEFETREILTTEKGDANRAEDEIGSNIQLVASIVPVPESEDNGTEITEETEITSIMTAQDNESEKLQETLSLEEQEPRVGANEKITDETLIENDIPDEREEIPIPAEIKEDSSTQKEETCKLEETSTGLEIPNEELQKEEGENIQKLPKSEDLADASSNETSDPSCLTVQDRELESGDPEEKIHYVSTVKDENQDIDKVEISNIVKDEDEEVCSQKDELEVNEQKGHTDLVSEKLGPDASSAYDGKDTHDEGEKTANNLDENFTEEKHCGESSEAEHTRETGLEKEVENFRDVKEADSSEKTLTPDMDDLHTDEDDSSVPSLDAKEETNDNGQEEVKQVIEASAESKLTEASSLVHEKAASLVESEFIETSEAESLSVKESESLEKLNDSEGEGHVKNLEESFKQENQHGELSEINQNGENEFQQEVESFTDPATIYQNQDDSCEKIQSAEMDDSRQHEDDTYVPSLQPREEINEGYSHGEEHIDVKSTEETKSRETTPLDFEKTEGLAASGLVQAIEMELPKLEPVDPLEEVNGAPESAAESQSHVTLVETENEGKSNDNRPLQSAEEHVVDRSSLEEEKECNNLKESQPTLEPENETTDPMLDEKDLQEVKGANGSEEFENQIMEEAVAPKDLCIVTTGDEAIEKIEESDSLQTERDIEVPDSNSKIAMAGVIDSTSSMLNSEPTVVATETTTSLEVEAESKKLVLSSGIDSEEKSLERTETAEIALMDDEFESLNAEEKYELVSQPSVNESHFQWSAFERLIVEQLEANSSEEEIKDEQVETPAEVFDDHGEEANNAAAQSHTADETEEKLHDSTAIVFEEPVSSATEKIFDSLTTEDATEIAKADKPGEHELQGFAETNDAHNKEHEEAPTLISTTTECMELELSDVGFEDVEKKVLNVETMKENVSLEAVTDDVPGENASASTDDASIFEKEATEPREDDEKENDKDEKAMDEGEWRKEREGEEPENFASREYEKTESGEAAADPEKDVPGNDAQVKNLENAAESVSEVQIHEMLHQTKNTENGEDGAGVQDHIAETLIDGSIGESFQNDNMGAQHLEEGSKTEETQSEKSGAYTENEVIVGLESTSTSESSEKSIVEEEGFLEETYQISTEEEIVKESHQEHHEEEQTQGAAIKCESEASSKSLEDEKDQSTKINEILPVETNPEASLSSETIETVIADDVERPEGKLHGLPATCADHEEAVNAITDESTVELPNYVSKETIATRSENTAAATQDAISSDCFLANEMKNVSSELESKPISNDSHIKDEEVSTKTGDLVLAEAPLEEVLEKEDKTTEDAGSFTVNRAIAEVDPPTGASEEEQIKDEASRSIDSLNKLEDLSDIPPSSEKILVKEVTIKLAEGNEIPQSVDTEEVTDTITENHNPKEVDFDKKAETKMSTRSIDTPIEPEELSETTLEKYDVEDQKHGKISEIEQETNESGYSQVAESVDETKLSETDKVSFSELLLKSTKENEIVQRSIEKIESPADKELSKSEVHPTIQVEEGEEEEDEHKKLDDSGSDGPVMVEASTDIDVKPPPKKSHNILSGVGSKVKHSIAKVKKAITGKSSHQKSQSPKKENESTTPVKTVE